MILSLNELEAASGFLATVLFAFFNSRVAGQIASGAQWLAKVFVHLNKRASDAKSNGTSLTGDSAAFCGRHDVILPFHFESGKRAIDENFENWTTQVFLVVAAINLDVAGAGFQPNACNRALSSPRSVISILYHLLRTVSYHFVSLISSGFCAACG